MISIGYRAEIDAGQRFIEEIKQDETVVLLFHGDADSCCAAAIVYKTFLGTGNDMVFPVFMERDETIYSESVAQRILAREPSRLIVMGTGSRTAAIVPGITTMVIDHHRPLGVPPVDVFVSSYGINPPAPTALLTYQICRDMALLDGREWLAAVGSAADLGVDADIEVLETARSLYGSKAIVDAVTLVDAARRSAIHDIPAAFEALIEADSPLDISELAIPEATVLQSYRDEVNAELRRVLQTQPELAGDLALIKFRSSDLLNPVVAADWSERLKDKIVVAANYGYGIGKVYFTVRSGKDVNLFERLGRIREVETETEFVHENEQALSGVLDTSRFEELLSGLGVPSEIAQREAA